MNIVDIAQITRQYADQLEEERRQRNRHWARLKAARRDAPDGTDFPKWLEQTWGLKLHMADGTYTYNYTIVNESKYTMYLIKYGT